MSRIALFALALLAGCARQGLVRFSVSDAETGRPIAGAMARVESSALMAATDEAGVTPAIAARRGGAVEIARAGYIARQVTVQGNGRGAVIAAALFPARPRTVLGRVIDAGEKHGLEGVVVGVEGTAAQAVSGPDGSYAFSDFPEGDRLLVAALEGYAPAQRDVRVKGGDTVVIDIALIDTTNVGSVCGRVTDRATGAPLAGVRLTVQGTGVSAVTDSLGSYSIERVPAGNHVMAAELVGWTAQDIPFRLLKEWAVEVSFGLNRRPR